MNPTQKTIITLLAQYLEKYPSQRFAQALHNLDINQFDTTIITTEKPELRDIYNDTDEQILQRMSTAIENIKTI